MNFDSRLAMPLYLCLGLMAGCSSGTKGPKLAPADGTVTYMGNPLAGATVMFVPEKGPVAIGITDMSGKFRLSTGTIRGAVIGNSKVSVTATEPGKSDSGKDALSKRPQTREEADAYMKKANEMQAAMASGRPEDVLPKSLIPEKYNKTDTSGLSYEIKASGTNHFEIALTQ